MPGNRALFFALLAWAGGCNAIFGVDDLVADDPTPAGGSPGSGGEPIGGASAGGDGGDSATTSTTGGAGGVAGMGGAGGGGGAGGAIPTLVDDGLVARYYFDEAATGQEPAAVIDHAQSPVNVPISYVDGLAYTEVATGRGLAWSATAANGHAIVPINNTKLRAELENSTTATLEMVFDARAPIDDFAVLAQLMNPNQTGGRLGTNVQADTFPALEYNDTSGGTDVNAVWNVDVVDVGRVIAHVVIDTTRAVAAQRSRFYLDGVEAQPFTVFTMPIIDPALDEGIDLCDPCVLTFGNNANANRALHGTLYYAAIYNGALTPQEIANNVAVLTVNDDAP